MTADDRRAGGIALALGGGAALGWAHIGVLRVLEEANIPIVAVAGTSIGALAGVCLAADRLDVLEKIARGTTRASILAYLDPHLRRGAWLGGRRIARELAQHLGDRAFEELAMPAAVIAADLDTAEAVCLASGPVIPAVTASMALPALFRPVKLDGRVLIDGGMLVNLPVGAARKLAPGRPIVAVDLMGDYLGHVRATAGPRERSALSTLRSAVLMMMYQLERQALALDPPDLVVTIPAGHRSTADFHRADELIELGRAAATAALLAIRALVPAQEAGTS